MANDLSDVVKVYTQKLDELAEKASVTSDLDGYNQDMVRYLDNAGQVLLPSMTVAGLGDYSRTTGFPAGDVALKWTPYSLRYDRGREFSIDDMDDAEHLKLVSLNVMAKFVRDKVVPEVDAVRLSTYAANAGTTVEATVTDYGDALDAMLQAEAAVEDHASLDGFVYYTTSAWVAMLKKAVPWRFGRGDDPDARFETFDGIRLRVVPSSRLVTSVTVGSDGWAATKAADSDQSHVTGKVSTDAVKVNFLLLHPSAVCQVKRTEKQRYFAPNVNQDRDAHKWQYRLYHDAWVLGEQKKLIYAHVQKAAGA